MTESVLQVTGLRVSYGSASALTDLSFQLSRGETLALIGANGAGKSTLFKALCGLVAPDGGEIRFNGERLNGLTPDTIVARGIAMVPEGRRLFRSLSVQENLILGGHVKRPGPWSLEKIYQLFPVLQERRHQPATSLSGGQQQMVAIGRALMSNPSLLLLDELSLGLAPIIIKDIYALLPTILGEGLSAILVEQDVARAMQVSDQLVCLLEGRMSLIGPSRSYSRNEISAAYFGT